jgi:hypothetical protein
MAELSLGTCEHCQKHFEYSLVHCGFSDCIYAYCDSDGTTAILSLWDNRIPNLPDCPLQQEICSAMESYMSSCECGGQFRKGSVPRCPHRNLPLSAELATTFIENNAIGTKKGWRWQRSWTGTYCIVIENKKIDNNFR